MHMAALGSNVWFLKPVDGFLDGGGGVAGCLGVVKFEIPETGCVHHAEIVEVGLAVFPLDLGLNARPGVIHEAI